MAKRKYHRQRAIHRPLRLVSPFVRGDDVRAIQKAVNQRLAHNGLDGYKIKVDGSLGRKTTHRIKITAFVLGLSKRRIRKIKGGYVSEEIQRIIRPASDGGGQKRSAADRVRQENRRKKIRAMRSRMGSQAKKAVDWALAQRGTRESPVGSNRGPTISAWQRFMQPSWAPGWAWCGAFTGYATKKVAGLLSITGRIVYTPNTLSDGRNGSNGFAGLVSSRNARLGDHALFNFGSSAPVQHTGLVVKVTSSHIWSIDGNTSTDAGGSQDNGGMVGLVARPHSTVVACARPRW